MQAFHVLAGPPGAGKSTVLDVLKAKVTCIPEIARRVLAVQRATGGRGTGDQDPALFVALMAAQTEADHAHSDGVTVFDRAAPDLLAFCAHYGLPDCSVRALVSRCRYAPTVFWFAPWQDIYECDDERTLDFEGAKAFGTLLRKAYLASGYTLLDVPRVPPESRAAFIFEAIVR